MTAPNYPEWAGRFRAVIVSMLKHGDEISADLAAEAVAEFDRVSAAARMTSPLGDHRERSVPCIDCRRPTWTIEPRCDACHERMADVRATGDGSAA